MSRIFVPTTGAADWQKLLANPNLHWVPEHSAYELAVTWEVAQKKSKLSARGLPQEVADLLDQQPDTNGASLIFAVPEHQVALKGQGYASQTDLWALLRSSTGLISMAVEGKAGEPFDVTVKEWLDRADNQRSADNRQVRLNGLGDTLGLSAGEMQEPNLDPFCYQLLHRTASAILEAQRCGADHAIMLVQSFTKTAGHPSKEFDDFAAFARLMGAQSVTWGQLISVRAPHGIRLSLAWLDCSITTPEDAVLAGLPASPMSTESALQSGNVHPDNTK